MKKNNDTIIAPGGWVWSKKAAEQISSSVDYQKNPRDLANILPELLKQWEKVLIPIHNVYGWNVYDTLKSITSMVDSWLWVKINKIVKQEIKHALCWLPWQKLSDITSIYSHPQAIKQCLAKITKYKINTVETWWTWTMLWQIKENEWLILDENTALENGLEIYDKNLWPKENYTYFALLSLDWDHNEENLDDISIWVLDVDNTQGSLLLQSIPLLLSEIDLKQITSVLHDKDKWHIWIVWNHLKSIKYNEISKWLKEGSEDIISWMKSTIETILSLNYGIKSDWKNVIVKNLPWALINMLIHLKYYWININSLESKVEWKNVVFSLNSDEDLSVINNTINDKSEISKEVISYLVSNLSKLKEMKIL